MSGSSNSSNVAVFFTHSHCDWRPMWREALYQMFYIIILFIPSKQHWGRQDCPPFVSEDSELHRLNLLSEVTQLVSGRAGIWTWFYPAYFHYAIPLQFSSVAQSCPTLCDPMNHSPNLTCPKLTWPYREDKQTSERPLKASFLCEVPIHPLGCLLWCMYVTCDQSCHMWEPVLIWTGNMSKV